MKEKYDIFFDEQIKHEGWATDRVGQGYGSGYPIEVLMQ